MTTYSREQAEAKLREYSTSFRRFVCNHHTYATRTWTASPSNLVVGYHDRLEYGFTVTTRAGTVKVEHRALPFGEPLPEARYVFNSRVFVEIVQKRGTRHMQPFRDYWNALAKMVENEAAALLAAKEQA